MWKQELPYFSSSIAIWENNLADSYKFNKYLLYTPSVPLLVIYPSEIKMHIQIKTSTYML
jgi:hypothetical protein